MLSATAWQLANGGMIESSGESLKPSLAFGALPGMFLTAPSAASPEDIALNYLRNHTSDLGVLPSDVKELHVSTQYTDEDTKITHIVIEQRVDDLEVLGSSIVVNVLSSGEILSVGNRLQRGLRNLNYDSNPRLTAAEAIDSAVKVLGIKSSENPAQLSAPVGVSRKTFFSTADVAVSPIRAELILVPQSNGALQLGWNVEIECRDSDDWFVITIDAQSGAELHRVNYNSHASYRVLTLPTSSPDDGERVLAVNPASNIASPFGWHDTDGVVGAEYTRTKGNNVLAGVDLFSVGSARFQPEGGHDLSFDFELDLDLNPGEYQSAAVTQLFYTVNWLHDAFSTYGFTEAAGNFQQLNYSGLGLGNDPIQASAQDIDKMNNASFATPPDGQAPKMRMHLYTFTTPARDSDLDLDIMVHEFGHGVTSRLTGGPNDEGSLDGLQSGGMGEGWSDFFAHAFTARSTDRGADAHELGEYARNGSGLRSVPYSTDMSIDGYTYGRLRDLSEVHDIGEVWCGVLTDLYWNYVAKYGFNEDLVHGTGGNNRAVKLVVDALKLQPAQPTFLDARNALLAADVATTGGINNALIWETFARRGMGYSAEDGLSSNSTAVLEAFDIPPADTDVNQLYSLGFETEVGQSATYFTIKSAIGDSWQHEADYDIFRVHGVAGRTLDALTYEHQGFGLFDTTLRLFNSSGYQIAIDDNGGAGDYSWIHYTFPTTGEYFVGVSHSGNVGYKPYSIPSEAVPSATGHYRLDLKIDEDVGDLLTTADPTRISLSSGESTRVGHLGDGTTGANDIDLYRFDGARGAKISIGVESAMWLSPVDPVVRLFDANGAEIGFDDDSGPGTDAFLELELLRSGTYYLGISGHGNASYAPSITGTSTNGSTGDYLLRMSVTADPDPGDSLATAFETHTTLRGIGGSFSHNGTIGDGPYGTYDVDLFRFEAAIGDQFSAETRTPFFGVAVDTLLRLFDSEGNELALDDNSNLFGMSHLLYTFSATGVYYIGVSSSPTTHYSPLESASGWFDGNTGDYDLFVHVERTADVKDVIEEAYSTGVSVLAPGGGYAQTATLGDGRHGRRDVDLYAFQATINSQVTLATTHPSGGIETDTVIRLFDGDGIELIRDDDSGPGLYSWVNYAITRTGMYFAGVSGAGHSDYDPTTAGKGAAGRTGDYRLALEVESPADVGDTLPTALATGLGPHVGTFSKTAPIGDGPSAATDVDVDLYRFDAFAGGTLIATTGRPSGGALLDPVLRLFDANGVALAVDHDGAGLGDAKLQYIFTQAGTYYIGVSSESNSSYFPATGAGVMPASEGDYRLDLRLIGPELTVEPISVTEGDAGSKQMTFNVRLSEPSTSVVSVGYSIVPGTATAGTDYLAPVPTTLVIPAGVVSMPVNVTILGDAFNEPNETLSLALTQPTGAALATPSTTGEIINDDPLPVLSISSRSALEGNGTGTTSFGFTVSLSAPIARVVTVRYATVNDTAIAGSDYSVKQGTLTFQPGGSLSQSISISVTRDTINEPTESFFVRLSDPTNSRILVGEGVGTIQNDDNAVTVDSPTITEGTGGASELRYTVSLAQRAAGPVSVQYATGGGTPLPTPGVDYFARTGTVVFAPGESSQVVVVPVIGDALDEADEVLQLSLSSPVGAILSGISRGVGTIIDDDAFPTITVSDAVMIEGNSGTKYASFALNLSAPSGRVVSVPYATADGDATVAGGDYVSLTGTLNFAIGATTQVINVPIVTDTSPELDESFWLDIGPAINGVVATPRAQGTIRDDDGMPLLSIADRAVNEGTGAGTTGYSFVVSLSAASTRTVTVSYSTSNGTATAGSDYIAKSGLLTFNPGVLSQTVVVSGYRDALNEGNETFLVNLSSSLNAGIFDGQGIGTIQNDDSSVSVDSPSIDEGTGGTSKLTFTVSLSAPSVGQTTVRYGTSAGTPIAAAGVDYAATTGELVFAAGERSKTVDVIVNSDNVDEENEQIGLTLSSPVGALLSPTYKGYGIIRDDDLPPVLSVSDVRVAEGNSGVKSVTFSLQLSHVSERGVSLQVETAGATATGGIDYSTVAPTYLVIAAGTQSKTYTINIITDRIKEDDEYFEFVLSNVINATLARSRIKGWIVDDDE